MGSYNSQANKPSGNSTGGSSGFDPMPVAWYTVEIMDTEVKPTRKGGEGIKLEYSLIAGKYINRKVWGWINTKNANQIAEDIGREELATLCEAAGLPDGIQRDTNELHGKVCDVYLVIESSEQYGDSNRIKRYRPRGGGKNEKPASEYRGDSPPANVYDDDAIGF